MRLQELWDQGQAQLLSVDPTSHGYLCTGHFTPVVGNGFILPIFLHQYPDSLTQHSVSLDKCPSLLQLALPKKLLSQLTTSLFYLNIKKKNNATVTNGS